MIDDRNSGRSGRARSAALSTAGAVARMARFARRRAYRFAGRACDLISAPDVDHAEGPPPGRLRRVSLARRVYACHAPGAKCRRISGDDGVRVIPLVRVPSGRARVAQNARPNSRRDRGRITIAPESHILPSQPFSGRLERLRALVPAGLQRTVVSIRTRLLSRVMPAPR